MGISSRREKVLSAVVSTYINNCEPISSSEIQSKFMPDVSTATIRNELAILEDMGYLVQPHTSAGRIPTAEGYRLYVEKFLPKRKLTRGELNIINRYFNKKISDIETLVKNTAKVISEVTNLTGVAYVKGSKDAVIENIKIVRITDESALFIIVTDKFVISDTYISIPKDLGNEYFESASSFASGIFKGQRLSEAVKPNYMANMARKEYESIFKIIIKVIRKYALDENHGELVLEGRSKILDQPEYSDVNKARAMIRLLEAKEQLYPILHDSDDVYINIKINNSNEINEGTPECAVVTVNCNIKGQNANAGVIGPMRMDYAKVISVLDYIGKTINSFDEYMAEKEEDDETTED